MQKAVISILLFLTHGRWFGVPNLSRIFPDGTVAGETAGASDVDDRTHGPRVRIGVESRHTTLSFQVRVEIGQVHIVITAMQKHLPDRLENPRLIAAKMVIED